MRVLQVFASTNVAILMCYIGKTNKLIFFREEGRAELLLIRQCMQQISDINMIIINKLSQYIAMRRIFQKLRYLSHHKTRIKRRVVSDASF